MSDIRNIVIVILSIIIIILIPIKPKQQTETILYDTIYIDKERIIEKTKIEYETKLDTFFITQYDTVYFQIPIDHKEYTDTFRTDTSEVSLKVKYSGFNADIDNIELATHYWKNKPIEPKRVRFGQSVVLGGSIGYGFTGNQFSPYIGLSVTYGFGISW